MSITGQTMMMFGRTAEEIKRALDYYDGRIPVMTREEALKKTGNATNLIECLEALDLIKFDEAPKSSLINIVVELPNNCKIYQVIAKRSDGYLEHLEVRNSYPLKKEDTHIDYKVFLSCGITKSNVDALETKGYKIVKL